MSWAKRNLYFLISAIVAVVLLVVAAWYCYSSSQANNTAGSELNDAYNKLKQLKNPSDEAIQAAKDQTKDVQARVAVARKSFMPVPSIPPTNQLNERSLVFALRDTIDQLRGAAAQHNVTLPPDFAFSFTLQRTKTAYDPQSWGQLSTQLGEIKMICDTLFGCRVSSLDGIQREHTADDGMGAVGEGGTDYLDTGSVTNGSIVITPYQISFSCFTTELGSVLSSFAN
ncbi:MAG TPA: Amuc_1100 family pilus-like protein, partial [Candidatus Polarisedimenticolia bacterium]|nr:Amuc_1100 family pilus-like protein [Candidatus Polarisedimenticolia bacterium]